MKRNHFPPIAILLLASVLVFSGYQWGRVTALEAEYRPSVTDTDQPTDVEFDLFWEAWSKVQERFVGDPDEDQLTEGAIEGMVGALGDPYTVYLDPAEAKELSQGLSGVFSGIGAEIAVKDQRLVIVAPLPDSPADKAGLKPGDQIQMIDGESVEDLSFTEAIGKIRGEKGTVVTLTVFRDGFDAAREFKVTRDEIVVKSVESEVRADKIGYLKISAFHEDTTQLASSALDTFIKAGVTGVILDLRANPGGLFSEGISITSLFLAKGDVVKQQDHDGQVESYQTSVTAKMPETPLVVLVDKGSASASEIVAGALQDHQRATLVGGTTFGKGSVQELDDLSNGGQIKVTIAKWLTPSDRQIDGVGIEPDITVELTEEDEAAGRDPQLDRAVEELSK